MTASDEPWIWKLAPRPSHGPDQLEEQVNAIEWVHPRKGRVREVACPAHESLLLSALRFLGIGCMGSVALSTERTCLRCAHPSEHPCDFLAPL